MTQLDDLYRRVIMDHYKNPRNRGKFVQDQVTIRLNNPTCGDQINLQLETENGIVRGAKFSGEGCSISMSSASMMTEAVKGKSYEEAMHLIDNFSCMMKGEDIEFNDYEDIEALSGVGKFPARIKCAMLPWNALKKGIETEKEEKPDK